LYSQQVRLRANQPGLSGWRQQEADERLEEAVRLLDAALIELEEGGEPSRSWAGLRRAAELLEWLSHPDICPRGVPVRLLAAAAYQLAGYPARSSGLLLAAPEADSESKVLRHLLQTDFTSLTDAVVHFWSESGEPVQVELTWADPDQLRADVREWVVQQTLSAIGVLVAEMRWGSEARTGKALMKLSAIADLLLHGDYIQSWFLAKLSASVADRYVESSLRRQLSALQDSVSASGRQVFERYARHAYHAGRALAWPSQVQGIRRLASGESFALCAPTGSGKTAIAELAIVQALFGEPERAQEGPVHTSAAPLALYLVPSRALAAEVEAGLSRLVQRLGEQRVVVTALYGGTDWGPTDAWLTREDRVILVCTYEKAEALIRFMGPLFLHRVSLLVIDEAHRVQFDGDEIALQEAESRPLRLEVLCSRLLGDRHHMRAVALSAVAAGAEQALAAWVQGQRDGTPEHSDYRSTRQLIGRLVCLPRRRFEIRYDLLDGAPLEFEEAGSSQRPFVPEPFPPYPLTRVWRKRGRETRVRPYLFWAAMHLCRQAQARHQPAVLVSVTQHIGGYADDFLCLLESDWSEVELPTFFEPPTEAEKQELWRQCLDACEDYFGLDSREYRLLRRGVIIHHGSMPGRLARLLVEAIEQRVVRLVIATSTLTEGVNLPFETVLLPTLRRGRSPLGPREFANLAGRAGRPGYGTEGRTLVLIAPTLPGDSRSDRLALRTAKTRYRDIIEALEDDVSALSPQSPLAELLRLLWRQWTHLSGTEDELMYLEWLERTAPLEIDTVEDAGAVESLDALDSILLAAIVELEEVSDRPQGLDQLEDHLQRVWRQSYAHYAAAEERELERVFLRRSRALVERVYPTANRRRVLYRASVPPRSGARLIDLHPRLRGHLERGAPYSHWDPAERMSFVRGAVEILGTVEKFKPAEKAGRQEVDWRDVLQWWLNPADTETGRVPTVPQRSNWHSYVRRNFQYKFNWGLGCFMSIAIAEAGGVQPLGMIIDDWPQTGLPWIVLWLKELIVWGTLEPIAAYLLARGVATTRSHAESLAGAYYADSSSPEPESSLNPAIIRRWVAPLAVPRREPAARPPLRIPAALQRDFAERSDRVWRVLPLRAHGRIQWIDPAGFALAESAAPAGWKDQWLHEWDFYLDHREGVVESEPYL